MIRMVRNARHLLRTVQKSFDRDCATGIEPGYSTTTVAEYSGKSFGVVPFSQIPLAMSAEAGIPDSEYGSHGQQATKGVMADSRISSCGWILALLALVAQLAFGAMVPRPEMALAQSRAADRIKHAMTPGDDTTPPSHRHRMPDCQFCPLCMSLATPAIVMPGGSPSLRPPRIAAFRRPGLPPPATAPPAPTLLAAQPRGPPVLV